MLAIRSITLLLWALLATPLPALAQASAPGATATPGAARVMPAELMKSLAGSWAGTCRT